MNKPEKLVGDALIEAVLKRVLAEAEAKRQSAGYAGAWDDGGAAHIEELVSVFRCGLLKELPGMWAKIGYQIENEQDEGLQGQPTKNWK